MTTFGLPLPHSTSDPNYDSPDRLGEREQQQTISSIVGLDPEVLTNVDPLPEPSRLGEARVRQYHVVTHERPVNPDGPPPQRTGTGDHESSDLRGYPALAHFISQDETFFVFRRFDELAARNLLFLQDELSELQEQLRKVDDEELVRRSPRDMWNLHSRREDRNERRKALMSRIKTSLKEYQEAVQSQAAMLALESAPSETVTSLRNWMDGNKPTIEEESHFLSDDDDLCSLVGDEKTKDALERFIERRFARRFMTKKHRRKTESMQDRHLYFYSSTMIRRSVRLLLTLSALVFLVAPVFVLYFVRKKVVVLVVIVVFSMLFAATLAIGTKSRNVEIFASMAAYLAVLVAFLGNGAGD